MIEIYEDCGSWVVSDLYHGEAAFLAVVEWDEDNEPSRFAFCPHDAYNFASREEAEEELCHHLDATGLSHLYPD